MAQAIRGRNSPKVRFHAFEKFNLELERAIKCSFGRFSSINQRDLHCDDDKNGIEEEENRGGDEKANFSEIENSASINSGGDSSLLTTHLMLLSIINLSPTRAVC